LFNAKALFENCANAFRLTNLQNKKKCHQNFDGIDAIYEHKT